MSSSCRRPLSSAGAGARGQVDLDLASNSQSSARAIPAQIQPRCPSHLLLIGRTYRPSPVPMSVAAHYVTAAVPDARYATHYDPVPFFSYAQPSLNAVASDAQYALGIGSSGAAYA
ncbi:hypothetical protein VTO73DRAFT_15450 [Trametes versicolor]